jgi:hypothetical protein
MLVKSDYQRKGKINPCFHGFGGFGDAVFLLFLQAGTSSGGTSHAPV